MSSATASRKRPRLTRSAAHSSASTQPVESGALVAMQMSETSMFDLATSPAPLINTTYRLAGGLDTPTAALSSVYEADYRSRDEEWESRRDWTQTRKQNLVEDREEYDDYGYKDWNPLAHERNGRSRGGASSSTNGVRNGWGQTIIRVAGQVWSFCRSGPFRGFYAGGGQGYRVNETRSARTASRTEELNDKAMQEEPSPLDVVETTPTPVLFSDHAMNEKYFTPDNTPPRPAKRIQREKGAGEATGHWVMVSASNTPRARDGSPVRMQKAGRKVGTPQSLSTASKAGRRAGLSPTRQSAVLHAGSPALHVKHPASFASPRSPSSPSKGTSLVSTGAQRLVAKRRRQEREVLDSIQTFNQQLKAMIREGKEALGTKFEVDDEPGFTDTAADMDEMEDDGGGEPEAEVATDYFTRRISR